MSSPTATADADRSRDLPPSPRHPWAQSPHDVTASLETDPDSGLSTDEAARRLATAGPNDTRGGEETSVWQLIVDQFLSPIVVVLLAAGAGALAIGEIVEAIAVLIAVLLNAVIGFVTEYRALASIAALRELGRTTAVVVRGGDPTSVPGAELVPGDVVRLEEGDVVPADMRLLEAARLRVDEAALTGESAPQDKSVDPVEEDTQLADRVCMVHKGTSVVVGSGAGVVTATGEDTQIGEVATLVEDADDGDDTPLEQQLDRLGKALIGAVLVVGVVVAAAGIAVGQPVQQMIETAVALAIAAVPEGLPVVATLALARGVVRMSKRNALVKRLASVETLGSASVVFADKTGTLTEGRMRARRLAAGSADVELGEERSDDATGEHLEPVVAAALTVGSLCGNATVTQDEDAEDVGDPMEQALQRAAADAGLGLREALLDTAPEEREVAFDRDTTMMATYHRLPEDHDHPGLPTEGTLLVAVKGAPDAVIDAATTGWDGEALDEDAKQSWRRRQQELATDGLRVLGLARRVVDDVDAAPYEDLQLLGMIGLLDPPRAASADAVADCARAGVEVVMVTGDQPATAEAVAREIGIVDPDGEARVRRGRDVAPAEEWDDEEREALSGTRVFARLNPRQKLDLIELSRSRGRIVGMTGDGVNDAPALQQADIGIAMGDKGTQVARDAADIVLQDDAFETIVAAIREGRSIFANIRRFVIYLLSGNLGEILAVTLAAVAGAALPLLPLQILYINLIGDVFPAAALGVVPGDDAVLNRPPRDPDEPILDRRRWLATGAWAVLIATATLVTFAVALGPVGLSEEAAVTVSFLTFVLARLVHTFNMREPSSGVLNNPLVRSSAVWAALATSLGLLALAVFTPLAGILGVVAPTPTMWLLTAAGGASVLVVGQVALLVAGRVRG